MRHTETTSDVAISSQKPGMNPDRDDLIEIIRVGSWDDLAEYSTAWTELVDRLTSSTIF